MLNFEEITARYGLYLSTFLVCLLSGLLPVINVEVFLLLVSSLSPKFLLFPLLLLSTLGQMTAKSVLYLVGWGVLRIPVRKSEGKMERVKKSFEKWKSRRDLLIFLSASTGIPPFYLVSILAGVMKLNFLRFLLFGSLGRLTRFSLTLWLPQWIKGIL